MAVDVTPAGTRLQQLDARLRAGGFEALRAFLPRDFFACEFGPGGPAAPSPSRVRP